MLNGFKSIFPVPELGLEKIESYSSTETSRHPENENKLKSLKLI